MISVFNGKNFTDAELACMPLVKPEKASERWKGVPHFDLVKTLENRNDDPSNPQGLYFPENFIKC